MSDEKTSLKEGYLTIVQARQILNGLMLSKEQIGDLLFTAHCERKLSPQVRKTWERMKTKSKRSPGAIVHYNSRIEEKSE